MVFRIFQTVVGLAIAACACWLIATGGMSIARDGFVGQDWIVPSLRVLGGVALLGAFYYGLVVQSGIRKALENILSIPELVKKLAFTLALLCIYRVGFHVPLPGVDVDAMRDMVKGQSGEDSPFGQAIQLFGMFTGGTLDNSTLFGLGIMPYITASIIFQLLVVVLPSLQKLQKEGQAGRKKIQEYTRYLTVALCLVQATVWMKVMRSPDYNLIYPGYMDSFAVTIMGVLGLTTGTVFLMWLGEQIDEYGIGNGMSLLIMAGIVARLPFAVEQLYQISTFDLASSGGGKVGPVGLLILALSFVFVVSGAILITQGQRRIPIQQAKHTRGRRVFGGQRHYMPLRVNHGGVMPIIFASSLMIFPNMLFGWLNSTVGQTQTGFWSKVVGWLADAFRGGNFTYEICYVGFIFFFSYFWTTVNFRPKEVAENLRDMGHFIPGLRPGPRTADYLEKVMERITYCGAAFLSVIAVIPTVIAGWMNIPYSISAFLGGTGLLIVVSVCLDLVQRIESNLVMRNYGGFLGGSTRIRGAYS